jgi:hypothetical protein
MERDEIIKVCKEFGIENYTINDDGSIDVDGNFVCVYNQLTKLPLKFRHVEGGFYCHNNQLTSLEGAPQTVGGNFDCEYNQLTSLEGAPQTVGGNFDCHNNQLTSLEGCPQTVGDGFYCHNNQLTSLKGCDTKVGRNFHCQGNKLTTLDNIPECRIIILDGDVFCGTTFNKIDRDVDGTVSVSYKDYQKNGLLTLEGMREYKLNKLLGDADQNRTE